jgi:predicted transcriptional regulator
MAHTINWNHAARVVAETELGFTVSELAQRHGRSRQVIQTWLNRERDGQKADAEPARASFADLCRKEREALQVEKERRRVEWAEPLILALRENLEALEAAARATKADIAAGKLEKGRIRELAGAVKIMGEIAVGKAVLFGSASVPRSDRATEEAEGAVRGAGPGAVH